MKENSQQILLVDDDEIIHQTIGDFLSSLGYQVHSEYDSLGALREVETQKYDLALCDIKMPDMDGLQLLEKIHGVNPDFPVILITGHGTMETVVEALRSGAVDFLAKPIKLLELEATLKRCLEMGQLKKETKRLHSAINLIQSPVSFRMGKLEMVGNSLTMQNIREQITQVVESGCDTILITGETGTGKEIVARQIHHKAGADQNPFIAVSCPTITETLFESEMFGHSKGAYTGAVKDTPGYFELADQGTLFLDEIGDLTSSAQAKLLRVLETRSVRRIGSSREINLKIRLVAATNNILEESVSNKRFREDLYYRLNVFNIQLPPLHEHAEDIPLLAEHFLKTHVYSKNGGRKAFSPAALTMLMAYHYPGNVRELRNIVERAAILCRSELIEPEHLILRQTNKGLSEKKVTVSNMDPERFRITKALEETQWNRQKAAKLLEMPYSTLRYKIDKLGIQ